MSAVNAFNSCLDECESDDYPFTGPINTWCNKQQANPIFKKLERVLVNTAWLSLSNISLWNLIIAPVSSEIPSLPEPFKFYNFRASHPKILHLFDDI